VSDQVTLSESIETNVTSVVAVHGLNGHREMSWTYEAEGDKVMWLNDFLPSYIRNARIMTFGYRLEGEGVLAAEIRDKAINLLDELCNERRSDNVSGLHNHWMHGWALGEILKTFQGRSLVFIGHNIGGTIIKQVRAAF
jgi:hypothetical protein